MYIFLEGGIRSRRYIWFQMELENGFCESDYHAWLTEKIQPDPDVNKVVR
jgi:hypothetical protein